MQNLQGPKEFKTIAGVGPVFMAVAMTDEGEYATPADLSAAAVKVARGSAAAHYSASLTVADVVFDELVEDDPRWPDGGETTYPGYNFLAKLPGSAFATSGRHRVEFTLTQNDGEKIIFAFEGAVTAAL